MKIYRHWKIRVEKIGNSDIRVKAGSDVSEEDADRLAVRKLELIRRFDSKDADPEELRKNLMYGENPETDAPYEVPICEEICTRLDEHNIVTRNRYGALVLNSEDHVFLDLDPLMPSFKEMLGALFGLMRRDPKERLFALVSERMKDPALAGCAVRVYETCKGYRVLLGLRDLPANSARAQALMRSFRTDALYAALCARQNCYRARLTPKPTRIRMRTALKFRFPYAEEDFPSLRQWLAEYSVKSEKYAVCRLAGTFGPDISGDPVVAYHDRTCRLSADLPLA